MKEVTYTELKKENAALKKENELLVSVRLKQAEKILKLESDLEEAKEEAKELIYGLKLEIAFLLGKIKGLEGGKK